MLLRRGAAARRNFKHKYRHPVAAALQMHERTFAAVAEPRPGRGVHSQQIDAEILVDRDAFLRRPVKIGIEQEFRLRAAHAISRLICSSSK
jgi:hypothetical protein